ncbi:MAG TPA: site-specific integrase [Sedimentisphaerales bacterium]|nr:site-specific integrase [Sedimentisphaerales bacterium]
MKKVWVHKRRNIKGWWVGWYEGGKRRAKALPSKALADHFRQMKYAQLNSDIFTSTVNVDWHQMVEEYQYGKRVAGLKEASIHEALLTLAHFEKLIGPYSSKQITQNVIDRFIVERGPKVKRATLNKDIRNLRSFLNWATKNRYVTPGLEIREVKVEQKAVHSLTPEQVKNLIVAASPQPTWRVRVLLAVTTGLRRGDIENLRVGDIHFDRNTISTKNQKALKAMAERPIPEAVMTELSNYVATLPDGQEKLLTDTFTGKRWDKIRKLAQLPGMKFHDLRKTFASLLAQRGVSTAVTQRLLEHSTPQLTNNVYTNTDPALRDAVDRLPVAEWL